MVIIMNPASGSQRGHIGALRAERKIPEGLAAESAAAQFDEDLTSEEAQDLIRRMQNYPKLQPEPDTIGPGMYIFNDVIYRVKPSHEGRLYAQSVEIGLDGKGHFKYAAGKVMLLRPRHRMTLDQAVDFGKEYGVCCVCGRILTNKTSIEAGIGPICSGRL